MTNGKHQILHTQTTHAGWTKLLIAKIRLPDGRIITREIEDHGEAACVLPYNPLRKTAVLVRQFRAPVFFAADEQDSLEVIAGILEETDAAECARRETMEEAGLKLDSLEHIFTGWSMPGLSTERMHFYLAIYSDEFQAEMGGLANEHEKIIPVEIGLSELAKMVDRNQLGDVKTLLLLQTMRLRKPDLFAFP